MACQQAPSLNERQWRSGVIVNLNAHWRIRSDPLQWIVEQRVPGAKASRHQWKAKAFHKNLDGAVVWAAQRMIMALPGDYGPDALPPLCAALDAIVSEVRVAMEVWQKEGPEAA